MFSSTSLKCCFDAKDATEVSCKELECKQKCPIFIKNVKILGYRFICCDLVRFSYTFHNSRMKL